MPCVPRLALIAAKRKAMQQRLKSRHCSHVETIEIDIPIETETGTEVAMAVAEEITPTPAIATAVVDGGGADAMPVF